MLGNIQLEDPGPILRDDDDELLVPDVPEGLAGLDKDGSFDLDEAEEVETDSDIDEPDKQRKYNVQSYPQTVETALRYGLSNRVTASMMNSMINDLKIKGENQIISVGKVRNMKIKQGFKLHAQHEEIHGYKYIGFDGAKTKTMQPHNKWKVEDKVVVICQARRGYVDHFIPLSGQGVALANGIIEVRSVFITLITFLIT